MSCRMQEQLISEGPESMEEHLMGCEACAADAARLDEAMGALWDDLDDVIDASQEPLVVAPAPPVVVAGPRAWWPTLAVVAVAAAVLLLLLAPPRSTEAPQEEADAAQPEEEGSDEVPEERAPLPLDGELDALDVAPLIGRVLDEEGEPEPMVVAPVEPPCPEAGAWWRLEAPMPEDCVAPFIEVMGGSAYELHQVLLGTLEVDGPGSVRGSRLRRFASDEVARLSREGRPGDATLLAARVAQHRGLAHRSLFRGGALAGREWAQAANELDEANRRRAIAYELAQGWVDSYLYDDSDADLLAVTVRDSLAPEYSWTKGERWAPRPSDED